MALVPALNSAFYAMNSSYYARWWYMPILVMCAASVQALEDERIDLAKGVRPTVAVLLAVFVHPATYWQLIPPGLLFVVVYAASMWLFGMNRYERGLVTGPLRRILHRQ